VKHELLRSDCFLLELEGVSNAGFTRCSGLEASVEVLEYREGGFPGVRHFRDEARYGRIVLERGLVRSRELFDWFEEGDPRNGEIVLLEKDGKESMRWRFEGGWPCVWNGPRLRADVCDVAVERVEIVHEGLVWRATR